MLMQVRHWFSADDLAELKLSGLPHSKRRINIIAREQGWDLACDATGMPMARKRSGKGGGLEYHVSLLPAGARADLSRRGYTPDQDAPTEGEAVSLWGWFGRQSEAVRAEAQRRLEILDQVAALEAAGLGRSNAVAAVATGKSVAPSTLWNWLDLVDGTDAAERLPHLAPRRTGGGKKADVDEDIWQALLSDYLRLSQPSFRTCIRRTAEPLAKAKGIPLQHWKTLWRKLEAEVPPQVIVLRRQGEEALRKLLPPQVRSVADMEAMELVNIDGHRCDVFVRMPDGRIIRPTMIAIQDVYSRKFLAWRIAENEDMVTARLVFADLFREWGIPKGLLADNGRAFASKWLTGGAKTRFRFKVRDEDPTGLLTALGITIHWAKPYRGQSKPIERGFRDLCDALAKHPAFEGAYTGNSPNAKPENYGNAAVDLATFLQVWNVGMHAHNAQTERRSEMARGVLSFDQVFDESYARAAIGKASDEQLRMALFAADQVRTDRKNGAIRLAGGVYWSPEMLDIAGQRVTVRFDPDDLRQPVHVYDATGRFLVTVPVQQASGFLDMAEAKARQKLERDWKKAAKKAGDALDLLSAAELVSRLPDYDDAAPKPEAAVIRPVRHRGQTAAALKPIVQAEIQPVPSPAAESGIDVLVRASKARLRIVQ